MSRRGPVGAVLLVCVLACVLAGCRGEPAADPVTAEPPEAERLVLVSGRDDHGMVALRRVPAYDAPGGEHVADTIRDGTLARVVETEGQWLRVATVEGARVTAWINDFYLRGEVRLVGPAPSCSVRLGADRREGGTLVVVREVRDDRVLVETVAPPRTRGWARRAHLQELPPQGSGCGDIPPEDRHAH